MTQAQIVPANNGKPQTALTVAASTRPSFMKPVVKGAPIAGYWRAAEGDTVVGIIRGDAPAAMDTQRKDGGPATVVLVQITEPCVVKHADKAANIKDFRVAPAGSNVMVAKTERSKEVLSMAVGTGIYLKALGKKDIGKGKTVLELEVACGEAGKGDEEFKANGIVVPSAPDADAAGDNDMPF
jgi:hypothetical protein